MAKEQQERWPSASGKLSAMKKNYKVGGNQAGLVTVWIAASADREACDGGNNPGSGGDG